MFTLATDAAPGRPNEDAVVVTADLAIVVDGAGVPHGGCHHGVTWYSQTLAAQTLAALTGHPDLPLAEGLSTALQAVADLHADTCDLASPTTPCAAIGILRIGPDRIDTLALSDVTVVVDGPDGPQITCDLGIERLAGTEPDTLAGLRIGSAEHQHALAELVARQTATRNRPNGWWVAASDPTAAHHADTNTYPRHGTHRVGIYSDGATRPVDQMNLYDWPAWLDQTEKLGPTALIHHIRTIENDDPHGLRHPRTKNHDDATLAFGTLPDTH